MECRRKDKTKICLLMAENEELRLNLDKYSSIYNKSTQQSEMEVEALLDNKESLLQRVHQLEAELSATKLRLRSEHKKSLSEYVGQTQRHLSRTQAKSDKNFELLAKRIMDQTSEFLRKGDQRLFEINGRF